MSSTVEVVVIGAHPMDAEQLGGGLVPMLTAKGKKVLLVHLTDGSRNYPALGRAMSSALARKESSKAAGILGAGVHWCGYDSRQLHAGAPFRDDLAERLREWRPSVVITHWHRSWHPRHSIASELVRRALVTARVKSAVYYGENFEDLAGFSPTHYLNITRACGRWWEALDAYRRHRMSRNIKPTDVRTFPYDGYYRATPRIRGLECGLPLAQALAAKKPQAPRVVTADQLTGR